MSLSYLVFLLVALLAADVSAWKGRYSSSTDTSTSRTYNPLEIRKAALRHTIEDKLNQVRRGKWDALKEVLAREAFYRDFSGKAYALTHEAENNVSQLWAVEGFSRLSARGGGLGAFRSAFALTFSQAGKELLTIAETDDGPALVIIDEFTGVGTVKCLLDLSGSIVTDKFQTLDLGHDGIGVVAYLRQKPVTNEVTNASLFTIRANAIDDFDADFRYCTVTNLILPDLDKDLLLVAGTEKEAGQQSALDVAGVAFDGTPNYLVYGDGGTLPGCGLALYNAKGECARLAVAGGYPLTVNAAAFDAEFKSLWVVGTADDFDFVCGYKYADILASFEDPSKPDIKPAGCFEAPAVDGFAIASST